MRLSVENPSRKPAGFTLLELLSVLIIIGLIAAIGLPALKGMGKAENDISAQRQLLDDLARARHLAIVNRSEVYMVFVTPQVFYPTVGNVDFADPTTLGSVGGRVYSNLLAASYRSYALVSQRRVGDQPGVRNTRYLTEWRTLPEGIFISTNKFWRIPGYLSDEVMSRFVTNGIPFPLATNLPRNLPMIVFTGTGGLSTNQNGLNRDAVIPLARGSIFYARGPNGDLVPGYPDVLENLQSNSISVYSRIRVDWLTGRARVEQVQIQ